MNFKNLTVLRWCPVELEWRVMLTGSSLALNGNQLTGILPDALTTLTELS